MKLILMVLIALTCWLPAVHASTGLSSDDDPRLLQKVTIEARKRCIVDVLHDLSKQSGIDLRAGRNLKDYQVRDRKIYVFAKDEKLVDLLNSIAWSTKLSWKLEGNEDKRIYRLFMDPKTLQAEADRRQARTDEILQRRKDQTAKLFDEFAKIGDISQADLAALKEKNPVLYRYAASGLGSAMAELAKEMPEIKTALVEGKELVVDCGELGESQRESIIKVMETVDSYAQMYHSSPSRAFSPGEGTQVCINKNRVLDPRGCYRLGDLTIRDDSGESTGMGLSDPESKIRQSIDTHVIQAADEGRECLDDSDEYFNARRTAGLADDEKYGVQDPLIEHQKDADLQKKVELKVRVTKDRFGDLLSAISQASGFSVVSDRFEEPEYLDVNGGELQNIFDSARTTWRRNWAKRANILAFRDRDWFEKLDWVIPEAMIEKWRQSLLQKGYLDIDQLVEIARLSLEQYWINVAENDIGKMLSDTAIDSMDSQLLQLYGKLDGRQRKLLYSPVGVDVRPMLSDDESLDYILQYGIPSSSPEPWNINRTKPVTIQPDESGGGVPPELLSVPAWVCYEDVDREKLLKDANSPLVLNCKKLKNEEGGLDYWFTVKVPDAELWLVWQISTPLYVKPDEKEQDEETGSDD